MDPISITGVGVGIVSLTIQLLQNLDKVYNFFDSIKDAPREIKSIQRSSQIIRGLLYNIEDTHNSSKNKAEIESAITECSETVQELLSLTNAVVIRSQGSDALSRSRLSLAIKRKSGRLKTLQRRLDSAKVTLILAQQYSLRTLQMGQSMRHEQSLSNMEALLRRLTTPAVHETAHDAIEEVHTKTALSRFRLPSVALPNPPPNLERSRFQETTATAIDRFPEEPLSVEKPAPDSAQAVCRRFRAQQLGAIQRIVAESEADLRTLLAIIHYKSQTYERTSDRSHTEVEQKSETNRQFNFESSIWLTVAPWIARWGFNYALSVRISRWCQAGWRCTFRTFNLVSDDSLIFELCKTGDLLAIQFLFSKRLASVNDVDSDGKTALHVAANHCRADVCRFLLQEGADVLVEARIHGSQAPPFAEACWPRGRTYSSLQQIKIFEEFERHGEPFEEYAELYLKLASLCDNAIFQHTLKCDSTFEHPYQWVFWRVLRQSNNYGVHLDSQWWEDTLFRALISTPGRPPVETIMSHCPEEAVRNATCRWISRLRRNPHVNWHPRNLELIRAKIGTLHFWNAKRVINGKEQPPTTPTLTALRAMRSMKVFSAIMRASGYNTEQFVEEEIELLGPGTIWTRTALLRLFSDHHCIPQSFWLTCQSCERIVASHSLEDVLWKLQLAEYQSGANPGCPPAEDPVVQEESDELAAIWREGYQCVSCVLEAERNLRT